MGYESPRRAVTYCNEYYTKLIESYTHMRMGKKAETVRNAIVSFFDKMPESERNRLIEYHQKNNLNDYFRNRE